MSESNAVATDAKEEKPEEKKEESDDKVKSSHKTGFAVAMGTLYIVMLVWNAGASVLNFSAILGASHVVVTLFAVYGAYKFFAGASEETEHLKFNQWGPAVMVFAIAVGMTLLLGVIELLFVIRWLLLM
jgi:cation transport ATPase